MYGNVGPQPFPIQKGRACHDLGCMSSLQISYQFLYL